jgi:hypothetical protein
VVLYLCGKRVNQDLAEELWIGTELNEFVDIVDFLAAENANAAIALVRIVRLHSFSNKQAETESRTVSEKDPACAMTYRLAAESTLDNVVYAK